MASDKTESRVKLPVATLNATPIAIMGGTFNPVHYGHLRVAEDVRSLFSLQKVFLMPNGIPPHRASPEQGKHRAAMLECVINEEPGFELDLHELQKKQLSYTVETLIRKRVELGPHVPLLFVIGYDSLLSLNTWHRWQKLSELCHLLIAARPGYSKTTLQSEVQSFINKRQTTNIEELKSTSCGRCLIIEGTNYDISSTEIRTQLQEGKRPAALPESVWHYIKEHQLYSAAQ